MISLRRLPGSLASALALSALAAGVVARGEVIFNTFDPTPPPTVNNDGYVTMSAANNYWQSQAFTTGGSATAIDKSPSICKPLGLLSKSACTRAVVPHQT
jgi:hypothetical protein